jgi:hypothetical protein
LYIYVLYIIKKEKENMEKKFKLINMKEEEEKNKEDNNYFSPTPKTNEKTMLIPDFSPILIQETHLGFKTNGSYKKRKIQGPESPIKLICKKYQTPAKIEGRDLFNIKCEKSYCRKLNFNDEKEEEEEKEIMKKTIEKNRNIKNSFNFNILNQSSVNNLDIYIKQNKAENEFYDFKTINKSKLDCIYKVKEKSTNKIFCLKKIHKNSQKNNINNIIKFFNDMDIKKNVYNKEILDNSFLGYNYCNHFKDFWVEEENLDIINSDLYISEKFIYILYKYYPNGDLLDYLEKLDDNFQFSPDFYWDIIFEMIMGLKYFHELGYLHLDVKPSNFLVDENGYLKLSDFGLCQRISDIPFLTDIIEGDKVYISNEALNFNSKGILNTKADIFSLGLSIFEIFAKIELPSSGDSWVELRSGNFQITDELLKKCNLAGNKDNFIKLINKMIAPIDKRADINELINNFEELKKRYELLKNNNYKKTGEML